VGGDDAIYIKVRFAINPFFVALPRHIPLARQKCRGNLALYS